MLFASPTFLLLFFPACVAAYFLCRGLRARNFVLLAASWFFYAWGEPLFVLLLAALTVGNHAAALAIDARDGRRRGLVAGLAVGANLGVLAAFKYAAFLVTNLNLALAPLGHAVAVPQVPLPLGISFFTLQAVAYLVDVDRRRVAAHRDLGETALFLVLFPALIAGPILRFGDLAPQLARRRHTLGRASAGLRIFIIGLAQKLLIADLLAPLADAVFDHAHRPGLAESWLGVISFTLQIYFDFLGYSNMAVGLGLVFGFRLPRNFRRPYSATSMRDFWRRWHISLSSWLRDYLYVPLGGDRGGAWRTARNLAVVFLLCGLWHGPRWSFVLWGAWQGGFLILERLALSRVLDRAPRPVGWLYATAAVMGGWVLFRSPDLAHAAEIWSGLAGLNGDGDFARATLAAWAPLHAWLLPLAAVLAIVPLTRLRLNLSPARAVWAETLTMGGLTALCLAEAAAGALSPFLYFRF